MQAVIIPRQGAAYGVARTGYGVARTGALEIFGRGAGFTSRFPPR